MNGVKSLNSSCKPVEIICTSNTIPLAECWRCNTLKAEQLHRCFWFSRPVPQELLSGCLTSVCSALRLRETISMWDTGKGETKKRETLQVFFSVYTLSILVYLGILFSHWNAAEMWVHVTALSWCLYFLGVLNGSLTGLLAWFPPSVTSNWRFSEVSQVQLPSFKLFRMTKNLQESWIISGAASTAVSCTRQFGCLSSTAYML